MCFFKSTQTFLTGFLVFILSIVQIPCSGVIYYADSDSGKVNHEKKIRFTAYPAAGYSPETSVSLGGVGFILFNPSSDKASVPYYRPSTISPYFLFTFNKQFLSAIDFEFYLKNRLNFNTTLRYFNYPDYYYGLGNDTSPERELFNKRFFKWEGHVSRSVTDDIFIGVAYEWLINSISKIKSNGILETDNPPGLSGGHILGAGPQLRYDTRNNILYPDKGIYLEFKSLIFPSLSFNDYSFHQIQLDFRTFTTVFSDKNILAAQLYYHQASGQEVPFYKLPKLGGDNRMRGIEHENRYIDHHSWYLQIEGRRHLFWRFGGVLFAGIGNVASRFSDLDLKNMKYVAGIGGRFRPFSDEPLNLRLDIGKGPERQWAIYVAVREAF